MLVGSYHLLLFIQTYEKKVLTKVSKPKKENKELKVHYMPALKMHLNYPKLEEGSNWLVNDFSTMSTFLILAYLSNFVAILA